jgi:hypothetical protein
VTNDRSTAAMAPLASTMIDRKTTANGAMRSPPPPFFARQPHRASSSTRDATAAPRAPRHARRTTCAAAHLLELRVEVCHERALALEPERREVTA